MQMLTVSKITNHPRMFRHRKPNYRQRSSGTPSASRSRSVSPSKSTVSHLVSPSELPMPRRPRNSQNMFLPGPERLLALPGEEFTQRPGTSRGRMPRVSEAYQGTTVSPTRGPSPDVFDDIFVTSEADHDPRPLLRRKKHKQWERWTNEIIPLLISPYLSFLRTTESMRSTPQSMVIQCDCNSHVRHLNIVGVYFESAFDPSVLLGYAILLAT